MSLVYLLPGLDALQFTFVFPSNRTVGIRGGKVEPSLLIKGPEH